MGTDDRAIRELHSSWIDAVNAGDLGRLLPLMADDVVFVNPGQAPVGRDGFVVNFSAGHQQARIHCRSELEEVVVAGDVAYTRSRETLSVTPHSGGEATELAGHRITIYRKQPDGRSAAEGVAMYRFTGFFAQPFVERPASLPADAVWRGVTAPFTGVGVSLPGLAGGKPKPDETRRLLAEFGLGGAADWLFIDYVTWAGQVDHVYGLGVSGGRAFGPVRGSDGDEPRAAYLTLMAAFGVSEADALNFPPFVRGFWGE